MRPGRPSTSSALMPAYWKVILPFPTSVGHGYLPPAIHHVYMEVWGLYHRSVVISCHVRPQTEALVKRTRYVMAAAAAALSIVVMPNAGAQGAPPTATTGPPATATAPPTTTTVPVTTVPATTEPIPPTVVSTTAAVIAKTQHATTTAPIEVATTVAGTPVATTATKDTPEAPATTSEDFGGGDAGHKVERLPAASAAPPNTGGGNVSGINEVTTLADGTETAFVVPIANGKENGPGLLESVGKVGGASATSARGLEVTLSAVNQQSAEADAAMEMAERKAAKARGGLTVAESAEANARRILGRTAVASYVHGNEPAMPELDAAGALLDSSDDFEYSAVALGVVERALGTSETKLESAREAVAESKVQLRDAEKGVKSADKIVREVMAARKQAESTSDALQIVSPSAVPSPAISPKTPGGDPSVVPEPAAASAPVAGVAVNDPGLNALIVAGGPVTFPVGGAFNFIDSWGFERGGGTRRHQGADIFAERGTPVVALESGRLRHKENGLGGLTIYLDGVSGNSYYYAHMESRVAGLDGQTVAPGQVIGAVGTTGNAAGTPPHLHFEIKPSGGASQNPYPALKAIADAVT